MNNIRKLMLVSATLVMVTGGTALAGDGGYRQAAYNPEEGHPAQGARIASHDAKTSAFLRKAAEEYIAGNLPEGVDEWRITELTPNTGERMPADFDDYQVIPQKTSKGGEYQSLTVEFSKNGNTIKRLGLSCTVEMLAEMAVAKGRIARGTTITADMLEMQKRPVDAPMEELCTQIAEAIGQVAGRNILPGRAVLRSGLVKAADVKAGDVVTIVAAGESVTLTTRGIAKKDGTIGEMIPVVNLRSNKKLFAKVMDSSTVQVLF